MVFETILTKLKLEKTTTNEVAVGGAIGEINTEQLIASCCAGAAE